jgi:hypothetical protein
MTENSDPLENPVAERINGILKQEYLSHQPIRSLDEAECLVRKKVDRLELVRLCVGQLSDPGKKLSVSW